MGRNKFIRNEKIAQQRKIKERNRKKRKYEKNFEEVKHENRIQILRFGNVLDADVISNPTLRSVDI